MSTEESKTRVYVHNEKFATFLCPKCGKSKTVDVSHYLASKSKVTISYRFKCDDCDCGKISCQSCEKPDCASDGSQTVLLERRRHYRKTINIPGICRLKWEGSDISVTIEDMSVTGLQIVFHKPHHLAPEEQVIVQFTLPGSKRINIARRVIVRTIDGLRVGVEYAQALAEDEMGKAIRFFLMT